MADFEQRDLSGILFKNDKKGNEKAPDYTGNCLIAGTKLQIGAWIIEGAKGKFMSLAFSEPFVKEESVSPPAKTSKTNQDDFEGDIPF
jgi:hypothetical protein